MVVTPFDTTTAPATVLEVTTVLPWAFVVVTGTATLTDAEAIAEVVETIVEPAESVVDTTTGTTMVVCVEDSGGGGAGVVDVVVGTEPFCLLIKSNAATANILVANGGLEL